MSDLLDDCTRAWNRGKQVPTTLALRFLYKMPSLIADNVHRLFFPAAPWYTNPQTEALCAMLEIENKVNPVPKDAGVASEPARAS